MSTDTPLHLLTHACIERLSAPTQFRITRQDKSDINLSWSRPMNEDISFTAFNLCWVNRASNKAGSRLLPPDITEFTFTEGVSVCDVIEFTVRAVNGEGAGNSSEPIQGHLFGGKYNVVIIIYTMINT